MLSGAGLKLASAFDTKVETRVFAAGVAGEFLTTGTAFTVGFETGLATGFGTDFGF
jgi:hypothetical protein